MKAMIHIEGLEDLSETFERVAPDAAVKIMRRAVGKAARELRDKVKARAPVYTQNLEQAIVARKLRGTATTVEHAVTVTRGRSAKHDAWYWHFIEFGTVQRAAQAFIMPTIEAFRSTFNAIMAKSLRSGLRRQLKKEGKTP